MSRFISNCLMLQNSFKEDWTTVGALVQNAIHMSCSRDFPEKLMLKNMSI